MKKTRIKLVRPIVGREKFSYNRGRYFRKSWRPWTWRIMFTVSWFETPVYDKSAFTHSNGYVYINSHCNAMASPISGGVNYTGSGESLDAAVKDLETKILATHSKTIATANKKRDKVLEDTVARFQATLN